MLYGSHSHYSKIYLKVNLSKRFFTERNFKKCVLMQFMEEDIQNYPPSGIVCGTYIYTLDP